MGLSSGGCGARWRAKRQVELIGTLPPLPDSVGPAIIAPTKGLYVGSTLVPSWLDRIAVGDLGFRSKAVLTRYPEGIMVQRTGAGPIWIPDESITTIRTEKGIAGKVIPRGGDRTSAGGPAGPSEPYEAILAIRWKLPSGTEIDTGFRGDDQRELAKWLEGAS